MLVFSVLIIGAVDRLDSHGSGVAGISFITLIISCFTSIPYSQTYLRSREDLRRVPRRARRIQQVNQGR